MGTGLGSSSAVCVALVGALAHYYGIQYVAWQQYKARVLTTMAGSLYTATVPMLWCCLVVYNTSQLHYTYSTCSGVCLGYRANRPMAVSFSNAKVRTRVAEKTLVMLPGTHHANSLAECPSVVVSANVLFSS
jgi:GHMP kinases N terminal domain